MTGTYDEYVREHCPPCSARAAMWSRPRFYARNWAVELDAHARSAIFAALARLGDEAYRGVLITLLEQKSSPKMKVQVLQDLVYGTGRWRDDSLVTRRLQAGDGWGVYSAAPWLLRVCDVAVDHINRLLGSVFPFAGSGGSIRMRSFGRRRRH